MELNPLVNQHIAIRRLFYVDKQIDLLPQLYNVVYLNVRKNATF